MKKKVNIKSVIRKIVREEVAVAIREVISELKQPQQVSKQKQKRKIVEKQQSIKDLQRVTDIAYKYSNDQWAHKPEWQLDRKTGSPIDVADPINQNTKTVKQLQELKSWSQGGRVNAPHVKLNSAGTKLNAAPKGSDFYYRPDLNVLELKSNPSPLRSAPQAAKKKAIAADNDPTAGAKYIDWWDRIETKNRI